jgi:hypothetical protein
MATTAINPDGSTRIRFDTLPRRAQLASWRTPTAEACDHKTDDRALEKTISTQRGMRVGLADQAKLASWATPRAEDAESAGMRWGRNTADTLTAQTSLASWPTPNAMDAMERKQMRPSRKATGRKVGYLSEAVATYGQPMRISTSGGTVTGFSAATGSGDLLNPALSRWLMGVPPGFCESAVTAMEFVFPPRARSSSRTSKLKPNANEEAP